MLCWCCTAKIASFSISLWIADGGISVARLVQGSGVWKEGKKKSVQLNLGGILCFLCMEVGAAACLGRELFCQTQQPGLVELKLDDL